MTMSPVPLQEQKPNAPIFYEDILITHINGHRLEESCAAQVVLRLSPTIMPLIESDKFPNWIMDHRMEMPFVITVKDKCDVQVVLSRLRMPGSGKGTVKGSLAVYKSPVVVVDPEMTINTISFSVLNFPEFVGPRDKWVDSRRLGFAKLMHNNLQICLTQSKYLHEHKTRLNETGGYGATHTGTIERCDGGTFAVNEVEDILRGLRAFLSFCRGASCGLVLVNVVSAEGRHAIFEWGSTHTEPWRPVSNTWLPTGVDGAENLAQALSGFWSLRDCVMWRDVLFRVIDLYLNSKSGPFHVGIILIQAALECLCSKIIGPKKKEDSTGEFLSRSIEEIGLCTSIPDSCGNLALFFQNSDRVAGNGPKAITELRNDLVHAKKAYCDNAEAQMDALRLGHWYTEMILLKQFNYSGRYRNRLAIAGESPFEQVPWSTGNSHTGTAH